MRVKPFPVEKRKLIAARAESEILAFFAEISEQHLKRVGLPKVTGFTGRPGELRQKVKTLVSALCLDKDGADSRIWASMMHSLVAWVQSYPALNNVLEGIDNEADFSKDGRVQEGNTAVDIECIEALVKAALDGHLDASKVFRFYEFGFFLPDPRIDELLTKLRSVSRTEPETSEIESVESKRLTDQITKFGSQINELAEYLTQVGETQKSNREELDEEVSKLKKELIDIKDEFGKHITDVKARLDARSETKSLKSLEDLVSRLTKTQSDLASLAAGSAKQIEKLKQEFVVLRKSYEGALEDQRRNFEELSANLKAEFSEVSILPRITVHQNKYTQSKEITKSSDELFSLLLDNLSGAGLKAEDALVIARDLLAAVFAGQMPIFKGSLASVLAEAAAASIATERQLTYRVPFGTADHLSLQEHFRINAKERVRNITLIIIDGINNVAFEQVGSEVQQFVLGNQGLESDKRSPVVVLGVAKSGPSSLPISSELASLGPVFDTDNYGWGGMERPGVQRFGEIKIENWDRMLKSTVEIGAVPHFMLETTQHFQLDSCAAWARTITEGFRRLWALPSDGLDSQVSLISHWIVPYLHAAGVPPGEMAAFLSERMKGNTRQEEIGRAMLERFRKEGTLV